MESFLKKNFKYNDGILINEVNEPTAKKVSSFYSHKPFPNYKKSDDKVSINEKGNKNILTKQFKKFIGFNKKVLEVGCGTGQFSMYFATGTNNKIFGMDATIESLRLAENFKKKNNILNVQLINADIFDDVLSEEYFDFIWCSGVLHHTKNPHKGFRIIIKSLKKNGYILIGLYNKIGRIRTLLRKYLYKLLGKSFLFLLDPTLRRFKKSDEEVDAWIQDQYLHPQESLHTLDEVLRWFKQDNIKFISSIPNSSIEDNDYNDIFKEKSNGNFLTRILNQFFMLFNQLGSDGGLFIVVGKKND